MSLCFILFHENLCNQNSRGDLEPQGTYETDGYAETSLSSALDAAEDLAKYSLDLFYEIREKAPFPAWKENVNHFK